MNKMKWTALLTALCLLLAGVVSAWAEDDIVSAPVDAFVEEAADDELWTDEIAGDVANAEAAAAVAEAEKTEGDIPIDAEHFPDAGFMAYVSEHFDDGDGVLSQDERDAVTSLNITYGSATHYMMMATLQGIEWFPNLERIYCSSVGLERVDASQNAKLTELSLPFNKISSLDVSGCPELTMLYVNKSDHEAPGLTELDVSHNPKLVELGARFNSLTSLDLSACPALEELDVDRNAISSLDVSGKSALRFLFCYGNQITSLNISGCASLGSLDCHANQITALDLTGCTSLASIWCNDNQIPSLDVSVTDCLKTLSCGSNPLASLKLTRSLKNLYCVNIPLKELNLYGCPTLIELSQRTPTREYSSNLGRYYLHYATTSYEMNTDEDAVFVEVEPTPEPTVEPTPEPVSIRKATVTVKDQVYTGKAIKPAPVVKYKGVKLVKGTDYTVAYKNNKAIGKATVTIKGKGNYKGSVRKTFRINPKAVAIASLTAGTKQLTVKWKKGTGITGYQLQYSLKKDFSTKKTVTITKAATVKKVIKSLKSGKRYYVRLRAYKTVSGAKYYSAWSKTKYAKVK